MRKHSPVQRERLEGGEFSTLRRSLEEQPSPVAHTALTTKRKRKSSAQTLNGSGVSGDLHHVVQGGVLDGDRGGDLPLGRVAVERQLQVVSNLLPESAPKGALKVSPRK